MGSLGCQLLLPPLSLYFLGVADALLCPFPSLGSLISSPLSYPTGQSKDRQL